MDAKHENMGMNILYIDDDTDLIDIYIRYFENSEYHLSTASSAEEGFDLAMELLPDLIVCDVILPGMSGVDFCRKVRQHVQFEDTMLMLVTGMEVDSHDIADGLHAGADEYLLKTFDRDELFARLNSLIKTKRLRDDVRALKLREEDLENNADALSAKLDETRSFLSKEKELVNSSLKQVSLMTAEREDRVTEIKQLEGRIETNKEHLISVFSQLIESKPQYHRGHGPNVAKISESLAQMMTLPVDEVADIHAAALLHELGKLSIPEGLALKRPGDYSPSEQDMMALHPVKGWDLLHGFDGMQRVAKIIRHIHERIDGSGFPDGLKKSRIPLGSRIVAAVSFYDNAVYRGADMTPETALDWMDSETDTRFDPHVISFLRRYAGRHDSYETKKNIEIRLFEVKPGMTLAAGLYTAKGTKLLPENTTLTQDTINQIARYNKIDLLDETIFIKE